MTRGRRVAVAVSGGIVFTALLGYGMTRDAREIPSPLIGHPAPEFSLETLAGDSVSLPELQGRVTVVNFWASWCLACRQEHPSLVRAWRRYEEGGQPVRFLGIVYQDTRTNAIEYMRRQGGGWSNLLDPGARTAIDFGVYGVPETYFLDPQGLIAHKHVGPVTDELLTREIERLLDRPERSPDPATDDSQG
jgi:cytochrome c biogenesis protein CcmG/thiol:disulfide interchange protein DsbE